MIERRDGIPAESPQPEVIIETDFAAASELVVRQPWSDQTDDNEK